MSDGGRMSDGGGGEGGRELATLGGGCFWCLEAAFEQLSGVESIVSGFSGGSVEDPGYQQIARGDTGHAEVVQVSFDPQVLSYRSLLEVFFAIHDPTTVDRQGADRGPQYRSIILSHNALQEAAARTMVAEVDASGEHTDPVVTELKSFEAFYPAGPEHQSFYARNSAQPYCRIVIDPKLTKLRRGFADRLKG